MAELGNRVGDLGRDAADSLRRAKDDYAALDRFGKLRFWIIGAFVLDLMLTVAYVALSSGSGPILEAWYQRSFPFNMLVVRNLDSDPLSGVELVLDGRWRAELPSLSPGPNGFQVERDFRDGAGERPPPSYVPKALEVRAGGDSHHLPIVANKAIE